jgi:hypothetical protein
VVEVPAAAALLVVPAAGVVEVPAVAALLAVPAAGVANPAANALTTAAKARAVVPKDSMEIGEGKKRAIEKTPETSPYHKKVRMNVFGLGAVQFVLSRSFDIAQSHMLSTQCHVGAEAQHGSHLYLACRESPTATYPTWTLQQGRPHLWRARRQ